MTIKDVAKNLGIHWDTVKEIEKKKLARKYKRVDLRGVTHIAIDEFAIKKGHVYQTVVMDLLQGRIIYVAKDREMSSLDNFWKMVDREKVKIEAVAMDMWPAYIGSTLVHCPSASIVFDRFHIIKKLNEAIDETRRILFSEEKDINKKKIIKGTRWLLLTKGVKISESGQKRLQEALAVNEPLAQAYYLKEELDLLWQETDPQEAESFFNDWCDQATATKVTPLLKFVATLKSHRSGILNWFKYRISTGPLEGMNNKIKVLKRKAYGYRDIEYFNLKILDLHNARYALVG
jgi:transposase